MIGKKFGKWEVLKLIDMGKPGKWYECLCECGNIRAIPGTTLRAGRSTQCSDCQYAKLYDPEKTIGIQFGNWLVTEYVGMKNKLQQFKSRCICGSIGIHYGSDLRAGKTTQCTNCHNRWIAKEVNTTHGMHRTSTYKTWTAMIHRCENPKATHYHRYGGRGIKVCENWHKFENFIKDMGERPEGMTLDRINNDGNYEPANCRWISHKENCQNRGRKYKHKDQLKIA